MIVQALAPGAALLRGFVGAEEQAALWAEIDRIAAAAPFRHFTVPGGGTMSVATSNAGALGWVSDRAGYRYSPHDPASGRPWPAMPYAFLQLARDAAEIAGYPGFVPDAALVNRYAPGARMGLHADRDEADLTAPIVSLSLGLPAVFLFGGRKRRDPVARWVLESGDVAVWGGPARLVHHGVAALKPGQHALTGPARVNVTLRRAG